MQLFGMSTGKASGWCDWADEWLQVWDKTEAIAEIKQNPRAKLVALFNRFTRRMD